MVKTEGALKVITYGSGPAWELVHTYSAESIDSVSYVGRQSLISAMNGPTTGISPPTTASGPHIERVVLEDIQASLMDRIRPNAASADLFVLDITDERFGVVAATDSTYVTRSPQLRTSPVAIPGESVVIPFGTEEHFALWQQASNGFVNFLRDVQLLEKTVLLNLPWASVDELGEDVTLAYGLSPAEANQHFKRYHQYLEDLGVEVLAEAKTISASDHRFGPAPFNFHDSVYHSLADRLHQVRTDKGTSNGHLAWNWDKQHQTDIRPWTSPEHVDFTQSGRTEHLIRPRRSKGEKFPLRVLVENTGSDILLVISHGALPRAKYTLPRFEWLTTLSARDENRMFLSDTTLEEHADLELAWFTGDAKDDITARYAGLVLRASEQLGATKIVFIGGSGGGFASLCMSAKVPGSRALVFNPQTVIRNYWNNSVEKYQKKLFPELSDRTKLIALGSRVDATLLPRTENCQVIYVQNDDDTLHVEKHLAPYALKAGISPETGVSDSGDTSVILEHFADGHNMPYREVLTYFVDMAVEDWDKPLKSWHDFPASPITEAYRATTPKP
jgi:hypothetical protein